MATGILGQQDVAGTTYTNLYQCPADTFTVATVSLCNRSSSAVNVRIAITGTAPPSAPTNSEFIEYDVSLSGNGVLERTGIVLQAGKYIAVYASTTGISANAYGIETATV
jgi:hypothetical protein